MTEQATQPDAVTVAYVHSNECAYSWHHSMVEMVGYDMTRHGRIIRGGYIAMRCGATGLVEARNKTVTEFLESRDADWLLWLDTDMGFPADICERLLEAADPLTRPIVGALCFTQRETGSDGMGGWRCQAVPTIFDWARLESGREGFLVRWEYAANTLARCAGTGSAAILIHRSVFTAIAARYGPVWYEMAPNPTTGQLIGEDLSFCARAGALGFAVHVHTGVVTSHMKNLWLSEDDYVGQTALAQLVPPVPDAAEAVAVLVPTLGRPGNAAPLMESLKESGAPLARVYAVANPGLEAAAWAEAGAVVIPWDGPAPGTYPERLNLGYSRTSEPWVLCAADDIKFHPGWLDQALYAARDGADVIGTNDLHNPRVLAGEHATHPMVRRAYIDEQGAGWDGPKVLAHEGFRHWFTDDEIVTAAKQRDTWAAAPYAKVEHLHPLWGLSADDATYELGREHAGDDKALFTARLAAYGPGAHPEQDYRDRLGRWSDIQGHMPFLREVAARKPGQVIIELGVRSGNSTAAFLAGLDGGELWSCDIAEPDVPPAWHGVAAWHCITGGDLDPAVLDALPAECDVLFIDTSHTFEQTLAELEAYMPRVRPGGVALFHDTELNKPAGEQFGPVGQAITAWCARNGLEWANRPGYYGLGVIEVEAAVAVTS